LKKYAIIVAGGAGTRMGTEIPKQFLEVKGRPVLMHSMNRFFDFDIHINIIVVLPEHQIEYWQKLCITHQFNVPHQVVKGGTERFYSVKNGLDVISENSFVAIHDAVRPLVSTETISAAFESAIQYGSGIPAIPMNESIRQFEGENNFAVDRSNYKIIQTPQCFYTAEILAAYKQDYKTEFTDDATVLESHGGKVKLTNGNLENIKITNPRDLILAQALFNLII
jgi:2-C-methyl-D-erythritol 4-phosphate cytidylyltransferase